MIMTETCCEPPCILMKLLVAAFLACNTRYKILFALSMLHYERRNEMKSILPEYNPETDWRGMRVGEFDQTKHFPSSLWLRVDDANDQ